MRIQSIANNSPSMKSGLYFTKTSNVLFNKNPDIKYMTDEIVKVSKEGSRYIEDTKISQTLKDRFAQIPLVKELAAKFDTFIHFHEIQKGGKNSQFENVSCTQIIWADSKKPSIEKREFVGRSPLSKESATDKMLQNIEKQRFAHISK